MSVVYEDYEIGFFGNFTQAFNTVVDMFKVKFVVFESNKENLEIKQYCEENNIQCFVVGSIKDIKKILAIFSKIDFFIVASFGLILDEELIGFPKYDAINFHPGLLPQYRGRHPLPQAIVNKDKYMGITAHIISIEIDKGPILSIERLAIDYDLSYSGNECSLLSFMPSTVKKAFENYFSKNIIHPKGEEKYYKPLDREVLSKIFSAEKLKDLSFEDSN